MDLIANGMNGVYPRNYLPTEEHQIDCVLASIAYGSHHELFLDNVIENGWRLDIWMRYDHTIPVSVTLLKWLLGKSKNSVFCKLIPDVLHSKVIWWKGYGAFIGSANLSDRAWNSNIEAGLFFNSEELVATQLDSQLELYFENLKNLDNTIVLTEETVAHIEDMDNKLKDRRRLLEADARSLRKHPFFEGFDFVSKESAVSKAKRVFLEEWNGTLTVMRDIADQVIDHRPGWVEEAVPKAWQADQFLHAFYYNRVRAGATYPYEQMHKANSNDPWGATREAMTWWSELKEPPSNEDYTFSVLAPCIRNHFLPLNIDNIGVKEFAEIANATHATKDHISKIPLSTFGIDNQSYMEHSERVQKYAEWIFLQKNSMGQNVVELIRWVLFGGPDNEIPERIFTAVREEKYSIPRYGLNSMAELAGWARPDVVPPRNGRTSKSLRALGFPVNPY